MSHAKFKIEFLKPTNAAAQQMAEMARLIQEAEVRIISGLMCPPEILGLGKHPTVARMHADHCCGCLRCCDCGKRREEDAGGMVSEAEKG